MADRIRGVRGMHDQLPPSTGRWQFVEDVIRNVVQRYGYEEIRMPVLERTELFARSIGEATDIVTKEMYTFTDRSGDSLTLRPEGTAGCVRAGIEHGLLQAGPRRLWYMGPMFRHERPQKGRFRQFHQVGVEAFGMAGADIDAELILLSARIWRELGIGDLKLELNTLGSAAARQQYRAALVEYFSAHREALDDDSLERLEKNPLRILDSKDPKLKGLIDDAPGMDAHLDNESARAFDDLREILETAGVPYAVNRRLVRGLDYYNGTVFEWISAALGAQGAVCAGGRYDALVEHFGGKPTPAVGFAMGLERTIELLAQTSAADAGVMPHVFVVVPDASRRADALKIAEAIRDAQPGLRLLVHCGGGSVKSQFKKADKSGAGLAVVLGEEEFAAGKAALKSLRSDATQVTVPLAELGAVLAARIDGNS